MNFNYSYRAFLISCLLVGNLVLFLVSVKLSGVKEPDEAFTVLEYVVELDEQEESEVAPEIIKVETNTAYNEAEKFISEIENSRNETTEDSDENTEITEPYDDTNSENDLALNDAKDKLNEVKEKLSNNSNKRKKQAEETSVNRKTTISYHLEGRKALTLRNPVYTCGSSGKIVINIVVNDMGKVVKSGYNKTASTTSNGCLIDSALKYANQSKFTTIAGKAKQMGTITYVFPGRY